MMSLKEIIAANNRKGVDEGWELAGQPILHGDTITDTVTTGENGLTPDPLKAEQK